MVLAGVGIPVNITQVVTARVGPVIAEDAGGDLMAAGMFAAGWIAAQSTLSLEAHAFHAAQKRLVKERPFAQRWGFFLEGLPSMRSALTAKNSLEPHRVDP